MSTQRRKLLTGDEITTCQQAVVAKMCGPYGCTARAALNYRPFAVTDDGSCVQGGCMDSRFDAFEPVATFDDGSCPPVLPGYACSPTRATTARWPPSSTSHPRASTKVLGVG